MLRLAMIAVGLVPFVVAALAAGAIAEPLTFALDPWFELHCHRDPARTLELLGQRLPVCARCTGLYAGLLVGGALPPGRVPPRIALLGALIGGAFLLLDVATEALGWRVPSLASRFVTGLAFAASAAIFALASARTEGETSP